MSSNSATGSGEPTPSETLTADLARLQKENDRLRAIFVGIEERLSIYKKLEIVLNGSWFFGTLNPGGSGYGLSTQNLEGLLAELCDRRIVSGDSPKKQEAPFIPSERDDEAVITELPPTSAALEKRMEWRGHLIYRGYDLSWAGDDGSPELAIYQLPFNGEGDAPVVNFGDADEGAYAAALDWLQKVAGDSPVGDAPPIHDKEDEERAYRDYLAAYDEKNPRTPQPEAPREEKK